MDQIVPYESPTSRPLKIYAFDPSLGKSLGNYMTANVPFEPLPDGLAGKYLRVIDYDSSNSCYYQPLDPNDPSVLIGGGLDPSESDPRFHQQMVYTVASKTIQVFEFALGRKIQWGFNRYRKEKLPLRIYPHAMQEANAFYSRDLEALVFGYFPASDDDPTTNLPGQTVFTCLSHDVIAHETTHALIDGQRMYFMISTSPDTLAFHEGFADIVALFQHFSFSEFLLDVIQKTGGLIFRPQIDPEVAPQKNKPLTTVELSKANPLVQLAKQFGEAIGQRAALRGALGTPPNSTDIERLDEPHDRGAILVAAVFDAFFTIYIRRVQDLLRIAKTLDSDQINPDIAKRLADEVARIAEHFLNICIRALDYCPPVDIRFGDFLRAVITADYDLVRDDPVGYRAALIDAFRLRGIRPEGVISYAEESLRWSTPEERDGKPLECKGLEFDLFKSLTSEQKKQNAVLIHNFADRNRKALGLSDKIKEIEVHSFHAIHRVGPDGQIKMEAVAEVVQKVDLPIDPKDENQGTMTFYGGVTLVIDLSPDREGVIRYAISKSMGPDNDSNERLKLQRQFDGSSGLKMTSTVYTEGPTSAGGSRGFDFSVVHRGY